MYKEMTGCIFSHGASEGKHAVFDIIILLLIRPLKMAAELDEAVHLWTADTDGCIHILCNARCSNDNVSMKWREGDGSQTTIVCNNKHVCGIDMSNCLAARTGVAYDSPIGKKWSLSSQKIKKLAIGLKYLAVLTTDGRTLTCMIPDYIVRDVIELEFTEIQSFSTDIVHIIMDTKDVLYCVSSFGEVHVCRDISKDGSPLHWEFFTKPPSIARRGGFLSSLFASNKILFIDVAVFDEQIFFLRAEPQEIWQLVVTEILFGDKTQYKSSWNCFKFKPHSPKLSLIATNPLSKQELFGVSENGNTILALDLQGKFITITEMPFHGCGDIVITSLSSCHLKQDVPIPKIYPKLPKLQRCCETGDCPLCQGKGVIINITDNNWERKYKDELASSIAQWRRGEEYYLPQIRHSPVNSTEKQRRVRKRHKTNEDAEETPPTKRPPYGIEKTPPTKRPHYGVDETPPTKRPHYGIDETPPTKQPRHGIQETPPSATSYHSGSL